MKHDPKSLSTADRWAQLSAFFSDFIQGLPAYSVENPDPELVAWQHPGMVLTETRRSSGAEGYLNSLTEGSVLTANSTLLPNAKNRIVGKEETFELNVRADSKEDSCNTIFRKRFTMAHELGHYCLRKSESEIFRILGFSQWPSHSETERMCHRFAGIFLMPYSVLKEQSMRVVNEHPQKALRILCDRFHVNVETMIRRLAFTGVLQEYNWFIGYFGYSLNPTKKREGRKWRLQPDCICLPRGLASASRGVYGSTVIYINHPYCHTGIETLRLSQPDWAFIPDWLEVYGKFRQAETRQERNYYWNDLNPPDVDSRLRRNMLNLRPRSLRLSTKHGELPFPPNLLSGEMDIPDMKWHSYNIWNDEAWRLSANEIKIQGSRFENANNQLVISAKLSLNRRHKEQ